ncbi:hypothetical protein EIP86_002593 [Pleurotus ostreatoroseus]|nr:hypothetical protein EIP86_002593 [Pleurotus ostreatoroseus]
MPGTPSPSLDSPRVLAGALSDVPEESSSSNSGRASPYVNSAHSSSSTTFKAHPSTSSLASLASSSAKGPTGPRNPPTLRGPSAAANRVASDTASVAGLSITGVLMQQSNGKEKARSKSPSKSPSNGALREKDKEKERERERGERGERDKDRHRDRDRHRDKGKETDTGKGSRPQRVRTTPQLPSGKEVEPAPPTLMHWSRAPVYGLLPTHGLRAHSVTLVENVAWIFGGCDEKGCWADVWTFHIESMQWANPETTGDVPPPCRAHTATLVDRRIVVFGGGEGPVYYNTIYALDTVTRRWARPTFPPGTALPPPRRAHTAVLYRARVYVFGGGNGTQALNDLWALDVGASGAVERMRWEQLQTRGRKPSPRGYHTANLVGNVMVVMGGSDGRECFSDMWCLNMDNLTWSQIKLSTVYRRLSHTATQVGSYLFVWGGHDGTSYTSELLLFNLGKFPPLLSTPRLTYRSLTSLLHFPIVSLSFETRQVAGRAPSARGYHAALQTDGRVFVFGGFNGNDVFEDVHLLDLAAAAYLPQVTSFRIDVD